MQALHLEGISWVLWVILLFHCISFQIMFNADSLNTGLDVVNKKLLVEIIVSEF